MEPSITPGGVGDTPDAVLASAARSEVYDAILYLLHLRSVGMVAMRFAQEHPTEDSLQELLHSPAFIDAITEFLHVKADIAFAAQAANVSNREEFDQVVGQHYARALEALEHAAELMGVPAEDLASVLLRV